MRIRINEIILFSACANLRVRVHVETEFICFCLCKFKRTLHVNAKYKKVVLTHRHYPRSLLPLLGRTDPRRIRVLLEDGSGRIRTDPDGSARYVQDLKDLDVYEAEKAKITKVVRILTECGTCTKQSPVNIPTGGHWRIT